MTNEEKDEEWKKIQPILKEMNEGLSEANKVEGRNRALAFKGSEPPILKDFKDLSTDTSEIVNRAWGSALP